MNHSRFWPHLLATPHRVTLRSLCRMRYIALLLAALLLPCVLAQPVFAQQVSSRTVQIAHTQRGANDGPTLSQVTIGFDSRFHDGNWVPVHVTLDNSGSDFQGIVSVNVPSSAFGNSGSSSIYQVPMSLPSGAHKQITLYVPFNFGTQGTVQNINVSLLTSSGQTISTQVSSVRTLNTGDIFVGVLSDQHNNFTALSNVTLPNPSSSVIVQPLDATTLPDNSVVLKNFDLIVLDNFSTATLSQQQLTALQNWVNQGGSLLVAGGPEWQSTLKPLSSALLPVSITGTATLSGGATLLATGGPTSNASGTVLSNLSSPITISTATLTSGTPVLASGTTPLMVQTQIGQGTVVYLAFDPTLDPIYNWSSATTLWKGLLFRTVNEQVLMSIQGATSNGKVGGGVVTNLANLNFSGLLQSLLPNTAPAIWFILVLLLAYILILGPARMLIVRLLKKRDWSWRITLITIVVFSLLSYGLAVEQQGTSIESDSVSIVQLSSPNTPNAAGTTAHITTFQGVFVPNQGDYQIHIPEASLAQPNDQFFAPGQVSSSTTIVPSSNANDVTLHSVNIWTLRSVVSERDQNLSGGITSHLSMTNNSLQGTVTNTFPYALSDAYILIGDQYVGIGSLASGQTVQVQLQAVKNNSNTNQFISDQLASASGQSSNYGPYSGQQPQTEAQRHLAILSTLSGNGGSFTNCVNGVCYTQSSSIAYGSSTGNGSAVTKTGSVMILSGGPLNVQFRDHDPLAISGAPATLIGWVDNNRSAQTDITGNVTINGNSATGHQEILIQAPLSVGVSGSFIMNSTLFHSQLVNVQGTNTQSLSNGVYTMNAGSITLEYTTNDLMNIHGGQLTLQESQMLSQSIGPAPNSTALSDANSLQVQVYNWQKKSWDSFSFFQFNLSISNSQPYISSDGRILVQLSNSNSAKTLIFNKPLLSLQGSVQ